MEMENNQNFSFKKYAWTQFRKNKIALVSLYLLAVLILVAIFAPYIANDRPLYAKYKGNTLYPAFTQDTRTDSIFENGKFVEILQYDITDWRQLKYEKVIWTPIPYSPTTLDRYNRDYVSPGGKQRYKNADGEIVEPPKKFRPVMPAFS